ncbi:MAG TPA: methylmalonyl-CoA mutase family protein [Terriglobales bacterium]
MKETTDTPLKPLNLLEDFPPVSTAAWEEVIRQDLKGADYEQKLIWKTDEGISVQPYYRREDVSAGAPLLRGRQSWEMVAPGDGPALSVSTIEFHKQGATAVQEVAFALGQGTDLLATDKPVATLGFAIGPNHFMEIAKLRAVRSLWGGVAAAFGSSEAGVRIHACTAGGDKTPRDPYVNLLRVTTEALSAIFGGCDSLTITPCGFDPHLAENVHHIFREESHLDKVVDPPAGSYYLEALTDAVARAAWKLFQDIEAAGGFSSYQEAGALEAALARARAAREKAVLSRGQVTLQSKGVEVNQERP